MDLRPATHGLLKSRFLLRVFPRLEGIKGHLLKATRRALQTPLARGHSFRLPKEGILLMVAVLEVVPEVEIQG